MNIKCELLFLFACVISMVAAATIHHANAEFDDEPVYLDGQTNDGDISGLLRYLMHRAVASKRALPMEKRNNGVWIWMPAQGYVPVPKDQVNGIGSQGKSGKIMRYGR